MQNVFKIILCALHTNGGNNLPCGIDKPLFTEREREFCNYVRSLGLAFSNCYHAHGIGNNNEYSIVLKSVDEDGFTIEKQVCKYHYTYGIYCHLVSARLEDTNGSVLISRGRI